MLCPTEKTLGFLAGICEPQDVEDAIEIARYHRFHRLDDAPDELRDLCALMRIVDELDIGKERAPEASYKAKRNQMDSVARFHWLKHICTWAIRKNSSYRVERQGARRVLVLSVRVKATEPSWRWIQKKVIEKIVDCLEDDGVNRILRFSFQTEFRVTPAAEDRCGTLLALPTSIKEDLDVLAAEKLSSGESKEEGSSTNRAAYGERKAPSQESPEEDLSPELGRSYAPQREFKILAIPPEKLDQVLCRSGRLTVIGNEYIDPGHIHIGGVEGAASRVYVGPADCGKTRAATERVRSMAGSQASQWVVLRTDMGTVPSKPDLIVHDTTFYREQGYALPRKAILFLDDLPLHLPDLSSNYSAEDALGQLFRWFRELPDFRERHIVGTIRHEDIQERSEWPDILPFLGEKIELVKLKALESSQYRKLWEGMRSGEVSRSVTEGLKHFRIGMSEDFVEEILRTPADPEAVATFVHQAAVGKPDQEFRVEDAKRFSPSAVETWIRETWPAIEKAYGDPSRVFFSLARFLEARRRPNSGFRTSLLPFWRFHEVFGPAILAKKGFEGDYLSVIEEIRLAGHAVGAKGEWIRPKFDFLLQSEGLPGVEIALPELDWFAEQSGRLDPKMRRSLVAHISACGVEVVVPSWQDSMWHLGWGDGRGTLARAEQDGVRKMELFDEEIDSYRRAVESDPQNSMAWYNLGASLGQKAEREEDPQTQSAQREEAIDAYRQAVESDPQNSDAWYNLGGRLGQKADREEDLETQSAQREEAIDAYRQAVESDPQNSIAWYNLGASLAQKADREGDPETQSALREEAIDVYRKAVESDPQNSRAWYNLAGVLLASGGDCLDEALVAARRSVELGASPYNLACVLARTGQAKEALAELEGSLERGEVTREGVEGDSDWNDLQDDPRFKAILDRF